METENLAMNSTKEEKKKLEDVLEEIIIRRHDHYAKKDKKYKKIARWMRIIIALLSLINTIVLGLRLNISADLQLSIGLVISALSTFIAGILAYYNFEKYWMRNIIKHIKLNIIRDNFRCDKVDGKLTSERFEYYKKELNAIENDNIEYWNKVSNNCAEKKEV